MRPSGQLTLNLLLSLIPNPSTEREKERNGLHCLSATAAISTSRKRGGSQDYSLTVRRRKKKKQEWNKAGRNFKVTERGSHTSLLAIRNCCWLGFFLLITCNNHPSPLLLTSYLNKVKGSGTTGVLNLKSWAHLPRSQQYNSLWTKGCVTHIFCFPHSRFYHQVVFPKKAAGYSCNQSLGVFYVQRKHLSDLPFLSPSWCLRKPAESCIEKEAELWGEGISFIF